MKKAYFLLFLLFIACVNQDTDSNLNLRSKGTWVGKYEGDFSGDIFMEVAPDGFVSGYVVPFNSQTKDKIGGQFFQSGKITFNSSTYNFQGLISSDTKAEGRWTQDKYSGTWTLHK